MDSELLEHIQIDIGEMEAGENPSSSIIWLHGLGADGHDFEPIVPELNLPASLSIRFIFPHAPMRLINGEQEMRAWYDFVPHSENSGGDDIQISQDQINAFIEREMDRGVPSEKILLAGFSQGGVIALHTALRFRCRLAGVLALSTYLHDVNSVESERNDANLALPIMMAHGTQDPMIPIIRAATARENLIRLGYDVSWFDYPMGHQVCLEEIEEVSRFFQNIL